jgi:hypothetical protein
MRGTGGGHFEQNFKNREGKKTPIEPALQRHNNENWKQIFPEKELRASVPIPTFMGL